MQYSCVLFYHSNSSFIGLIGPKPSLRCCSISLWLISKTLEEEKNVKMSKKKGKYLTYMYMINKIFTAVLWKLRRITDDKRYFWFSGAGTRWRWCSRVQPFRAKASRGNGATWCERGRLKQWRGSGGELSTSRIKTPLESDEVVWN